MQSRVDIFDFAPRYHQLYNVICKKIEDHDWQPQQAIPPERELSNIFGVSRATARLAIDKLIEKGYLYRLHGRGTFVSPEKLRKFSELSCLSFKDRVRNSGHIPSQKIIGLKWIEPTEKIRELLDLPDKVDQIQKLDRLFFIDGEHNSLNTSYLKLPYGGEITKEELEETGSLYALLGAKFNFIPTIENQVIQATVANEQEARLLDVKVGAPLMHIKSMVWTHEREIMEFVEIFHRGDRFKIYVNHTR